MSRPCVAYEYLSCAVNRTSHAAEWVPAAGDADAADVLFFAVHKSIAAWERPGKSEGAKHLFPSALDAPIHVMKALWRGGACDALVSGTDDGGIEAWRVCGASLERIAHVERAHAAAVTALGVLRGRNLFVSGGADSQLRVWRLGDALECVQTIDLGRAYPLDMAMLELPGAPDVFLLIVGSTARQIRFFVSEQGSPFAASLQLDGHEDWVRCLDVVVAGHDQVHLASGSQDGNIRLWKIMRDVQAPVQTARDAFDAQADALLDADGIHTKKNKIALQTTDPWFVALDALLIGHDTWVTGVSWHPALGGAQPAVLLSGSADNSMIVWAPRERDASGLPLLTDERLASALWLPLQRLGDVGTLSGGFHGALWRPASADASTGILTYDRHGALHLWLDDGGRWQPTWTVSGHAGPASGIAWEPEGDYFLSVGADRTARLHAEAHGWHEIARPQTHGYDLVKAAWINRLEFASAADEKIVRIFHASRHFVERALALGTVHASVQRTTVMGVHVERGRWAEGAQLRTAVSATAAGCSDSLAILVFADELADTPAAAPAALLPDIERFLQAVYTYAWAAAVARDDLLMDISVYLLPGAPDSPSAATAVDMWAGDRSPRVTTAVAMDDTAAVLTRLSLQRLVHAQRDAAAPLPAPTNAAPAAAAVAALGGTFDHLHIGHKLLLTSAALAATRRLIVGVTDSALLTRKKHAAYVEPLEQRMAAVRQFLRTLRAPFGELMLDVVPISDVAGPAGTDPEISLLVLTEETAAGASAIADIRRANALRPLAAYTVSLVEDDSATSKVGSTAIRGWLEARGACAPILDYQLADALATLPAGASVPALGLSNRAEGAKPISPPDTLPVTAELQGMLLWPEQDKLYGHGYEMLSVAANPRTRLVASTCKAAAPEHAVVRLHDGADRWRPLEPPLGGHTLSVTRVAFTADAEFILTASRDRSWRVFRRSGDTYEQFTGERAHARIVWDAAWGVDPGDRLFATVSRDKTAKLWRLAPSGERPHTLVATLPLADAATAVALGAGGELAVGLENGTVDVYRADGESWSRRLTLERHHTAAVQALAFRPVSAWSDAMNEVPYMLLSAGSDGCVRLVSWLATVSS